MAVGPAAVARTIQPLSSHMLALSSDLPVSEPSIVLLDERGNLWHRPMAPGYGQYPTDRWAAGELVTDRRTLRTSGAFPGW